MSESSPVVLKAGTMLSGASVLSSVEIDAAGTSVVDLPSGRQVTLSLDEGAEQLQVQAPDGQVEVTITFTADGPVVRLTGARLELDATREVAVRCESFTVEASEAIDMRSREDMHIKSQREVFVEGSVIWLN